MSAVGTITKIATDVVGKAAHAVTHPRATVASVTGHVRDLAATVTGGEQQPAVAPEKPAAKQESGPPEPTVVPSPPKNTTPAKPAKPARSVEPSTTEPKAATRDAAHRGRGAEPTDDWRDELDPEDEVNPATGQPHSVPGDDEPLLDPSVAKAIRAESETLSRAADPEKE